MKIRKMLGILLVVVLVLSFSGCSKITEKIAEKGMEKLVENATGAEVDISKDGAKIEVDGGSIQSGDNLKWPKDAMGDLPEPKAKVTFIMAGEAGKGGSVTISEFDEDDAKKYVEKLKDMGFKEVLNIQDSESIVFGGTSDNGAQVNFAYSPDSKEATITYGLGQ